MVVTKSDFYVKKSDVVKWPQKGQEATNLCFYVQIKMLHVGKSSKLGYVLWPLQPWHQLCQSTFFFVWHLP